MALGDDPDLDQATGQAVTSAVPEIVRTLGQHGVVDVQWFLAHSGAPVLWLVTDSDAAKSAVLDLDMLTNRVVQLLAAAGVPPELARHAVATVESEETVARDFEGQLVQRDALSDSARPLAPGVRRGTRRRPQPPAVLAAGASRGP